ncbi:NADH-ubiquinone oxidoreductase-F iron-sulfur binding region domain-containing protein [Halomarina ordinaria]|uniref:NADH-ubiquinone oxidoreductase-F iron-sulfur binding region domain-containing protein n=1 Tax=Halomarina ordinaria TaxID=3033939 RepID=A0ABD5UEC6_9EURY|nr:NADH-ubiquinone oxidoreductase-F iron-sulfur binding region domain-containing protein [Halomarina sp. PSRA2]
MDETPATVGRSPLLRVSDAEGAVAAAARAVAAESVVTVGSTGIRGVDPLVSATVDGRTAYHQNCTLERARDLATTVVDGDLPTEGALAVVEHDADTETLPAPETGPLAVGRRHLLGPCGWVAPASLDDLPPTFDEGAPERALDRVSAVGLLGRGRGDGRADEPVAPAWRTASEADGDPVVVVNANEADRRNGTDRLLLESTPLAVLDGALATARAVGAGDVVVYCNEEDALVHERVEAAASALAAEKGVTVEVVVGPDRFIAGEMTMALEAMEGADRIEARVRPPGPETHGLYGRPTVIHTPRTFAHVRRALLADEAYDADDADPGTRLFTVAGDVEAPATVELPTGSSLAAARDAVSMTGRYKMACVGGQFGGLTRSLDCPPSAPALAAADLGTEGVVELLDDTTCAVATVGTRARFAEEENCGRCVPCREGSKQLTNLLRDVYGGDYQDDMLRELARVMRATSTCAFGQTAARPVTTAMEQFETEFRAHADGRCPSGACNES